MKSALKKTSSTHITAFRTLGETMSPALCRNEAHSELSCENGTISCKRQEIRARVSADRLIAVEPARERLAADRGDRGKDRRDQHSGHKAVPHNGARAAVVPAADAVRRLHGKARRNAADDAADQPCARRYKTDGRRGVRAERADHCGVDVLHGDRRYLCKYRRKTQTPDLAGLRLQLRHRFSFHIIIRVRAVFIDGGGFFW